MEWVELPVLPCFKVCLNGGGGGGVELRKKHLISQESCVLTC